MSPMTNKIKAEAQEDVPLQEENESSELLVRQPIRGISKMGRTEPEKNIWNVTEVNEYLSTLIRSGYRLQNTFNFGQDSEAFWVMYILVKDG
jgi:hypothetical protein